MRNCERCPAEVTDSLRNPNRADFLDELGRGTFGTVFRAVRKADGVDFAVKVIPIDNEKSRFEELGREIRVLQRCDHPCIVRYHETFFFANTLWVVMEFCSLGSLSTFRRKHADLDEQDISEVLRQCLAGLEYLHSLKIVHRDVKVRRASHSRPSGPHAERFLL